MEAVIQISEVNSKEQTSKKNGRPYVRYHITASDGREYTTLTAADGQAAANLRGQLASIEYTEQQNGQYTNYYLVAIKPAEGLTEAPSPIPVVTPAAAVSHNITYKDDKSAQINRSVAFKAAVELVTSGYLDYPGVDGIDRLTNELISVVEGSYEPKGKTPFPLDGQDKVNSGEPGGVEASDGSLVKF